MRNSILKAIIISVASLFICISLLPMVVSMSKVNQFLLSCINSRIAGSLQLQELKAGWTDGIFIKGLQITDPQGREVAAFKKISCDVALLSLIHAPAIEGTIEVESPKIRLIDDSGSGHFSIEEVFTAEKKQNNGPTAGERELVLSDLHLSLDIQPQGQAKINVVCQIENNEEKGSLALNATANNFHDLERAYKNALSGASGGGASTVQLDCHIDQFPLKAALPFIRAVNPEVAPLLEPALGPVLNAKIYHTLTNDDLALQIALNSQKLAAKARASIKGNVLTLQDDAKLTWQIDPALTKVFALEQQSPTTFTATIASTTGTIGLDGKMPVDIAWGLESPLVVVRNGETISCTAKGRATTASLQESLDAQSLVEVSGKDVKKLQTVARVNHPFVDPEVVSKVVLEGATPLEADIILQKQQKGLLASVKGVSAPVAFTLDTLIGPSPMNVDASFTYKERTIKAPCTINLDTKEIQAKFLGDGIDCKVDAKLNDLLVDVSGVIDPKALLELEIAPMTLDAKLKGKDHIVTFNLESEKGAKGASIWVKGSAHNLWDDSGLTLDNARILLDTNIKNLALDNFYKVIEKKETADKLVALFGSDVNLNFTGEIKELDSGTFKGTLSSPRLNAELACKLDDGTVTLEKPITAVYTLTPEAGEVLLKDINPLLVTAAGTESPIKLTIDSDGFNIPIKPFSLETAHIKNITLEPGLLHCKNAGMLGLLVNLLKVNVKGSDEVPLWFTPIYVEVKNGIVDCKRADALLANAFPIATWGKIDLVKNRINMTLGLSGEALKRGFGIVTLDPNYMIQIPIHGSTQSPKIDSGLATTKITALRLQQTKSKSTFVIGGLLEVATTIIDKDPPVPAPTTSPFPWHASRGL